MTAVDSANKAKARAAFLDFLRILAAFLVIVNHTNSHVFKALTPVDSQWHLSILWYYLSKTAVPLFIMISGACLLGKRDSYAKTGRRILRTLLALVLASYLYFLWDAWVNYGLWPRAVDFGALFGKIWRGEITDGFWYLPLYLGLLLTLPLWQRMASAMEKRDYEYLMALTFAVGAAWPLLSHYVPALALPKYLDQLIPCAYLGLFFAGHYLVKYREPRRNSAGRLLGADPAGIRPGGARADVLVHGRADGPRPAGDRRVAVAVPAGSLRLRLPQKRAAADRAGGLRLRGLSVTGSFDRRK